MWRNSQTNRAYTRLDKMFTLYLFYELCSRSAYLVYSLNSTGLYFGSHWTVNWIPHLVENWTMFWILQDCVLDPTGLCFGSSWTMFWIHLVTRVVLILSFCEGVRHFWDLRPTHLETVNQYLAYTLIIFLHILSL